MLTFLAGGYDTHHPLNFYMSRPDGLNMYVLLIVKVKAEFVVDGSSFWVEPNCAVLIDRNIPYRYRSSKGEYTDDWLHFDCTEDLRECMSVLPFHRPVPLGNPARFTLYIQQILWENSYSSGECRGTNVDMLIHILLNHLRAAAEEEEGARRYSPYDTKLQNLRLSVRTQPHKRYIPSEIAGALGMSTSHFQHLYTEFFGISFQADLIGLRIEYAKDMIGNTNLTMETIAEICGYASEVHFYRQFKKYTGMTPAAYRYMGTV